MARTNKTFADLITFTRSTTALRTTVRGYLEEVDANVPRFDFDKDGNPLGLLVEGSSTNLLVRSTEFRSSSWLKTGISAIRNSLAPNEKVEGETIETTAAGSRYAGQSVSLTSGTAYTLSCYLKKGNVSWAALGVSDGSQTVVSAFDLENGATGSDVNGTPTSKAIQDVGNGWFRCSITFTASNTASYSCRVYPASGSASVATSIEDNIKAWGVQIEAKAFASSYIPTPASFTSRASTATYFDSDGVMQTAAVDQDRNAAYYPIDGVFYGPSKQYEGAATNLLLRSETFDQSDWTKARSSITANAVTAPDGTTSGDKLIEDSTASSTHFAAQSVSLTTGTTYTFSAFLKKGERTWARFILTNTAFSDTVSAFFDIENGVVGVTSGPVDEAKIEEYADGWFRCSVTATTNASASSSAQIYIAEGDNDTTISGDGSSGLYVWGAQIEVGSVPTSYIPTTTATVTRSADVVSTSTATRSADDVSITGTDFSSWFNASEGTFYVDLISSGGVSNQYALSITDGTNNNRINPAFFSSSSNVSSFVMDGGVAQNSFVYETTLADTNYKFAYAFKVNDFAGCVNGGAVSSDTLGTIPTVDRMQIGSLNGSLDFNGHIKDLKFYPSRLSNAQLQELTS